MTVLTPELTITTPLTVAEAIETRRSIRKFVQEPMNQGDLHEILRLASLAPTANNVQPTRFAVIQDPELKAKLQEAAFGQGQVTSAPAVIAVYADMEDVLSDLEGIVHPGVGADRVKATVDGLQQRFGAQDIAQRNTWALSQANIAFGFLMLAARGLGYDSVPMLGFNPEQVKELLGLPQHVQFAGLLPIGKRAEEGFPHHRHSVERIAKFY